MTTTAITVISAHSSTAILGFDTSILAGQLAPSSMRMYAQDLALYLQFAGYSAELALRPATLARWRTDLANNTIQSASTINRRLSGVKSIFKWAAEQEQGYISAQLAEEFSLVQGVKAKALKEKRKTQGVETSPGRPHNRTKMEPAEIRKITAAPDATRLSGKMHRALLSTLASSGCRISEVCTLTQKQITKGVDPSGKVAYSLRIMGKGESEFDDRPLSVESYGLIQEWLAARAAAGVTSEYVFTAFAGRGDSRLTDKPLSTAGAWQLVQRYADQVGLSHIKPHDFRRFVGTQLAKKNIRQAQKALGHKRLETTARNYVLDELELGLTDNLY